MSDKMHQPGTYTAKVVDFGLMKSKAGLPMAAVMFEYQMKEGGSDRLTWFGSFKDGARKFSIETLVRLGFKGKNGADLVRGNGSGVLDQTKDFEIVVANEAYEGKTRSKIKFVNLVGGSSFREKMSASEATVLMGGLNLEADFMESQMANGIKGEPVPPVAQEDDLPF